jgi:hypothetical protein
MATLVSPKWWVEGGGIDLAKITDPPSTHPTFEYFPIRKCDEHIY